MSFQVAKSAPYYNWYRVGKGLHQTREPLDNTRILGFGVIIPYGEVLGLRWRDINFDKGTILISNTVVRYKTLVEAEQTKSDASNRTLFIIPETKDYLLGLMQCQAENRLLMGNSYHASDHVCVWADGKSFLPTYISQRFARILEANGLPHIRFHELRHTAGSLLLERRLSIKQIQEYLGHEQVATTLDIYGHLSLEGKKEAANAMGNLLVLGDI